MPLEVRELVISIRVDRDGKKPSAKSVDERRREAEAIVAECVERVLDVLRERQER